MPDGMSTPLGERLRAERGARGLSQEQMGKLFDWTQSQYERIESGRSHHQAATLEKIDRVMMTNGFNWYGGLARRLDLGIIEPHDVEVLERLERIEARLAELTAQLAEAARSRQQIDEIRRLLG